MIEMNNVHFSYGETKALQNVTINEKEPIIIGLWGRNGAGKTTLMKLLAGLEKPESGTVLVNGIAPYNYSGSMRHVAYMHENHPFSELWNVSDALRFASYFYQNWDGELANELVDLFELPRHKKIRKFSKGMQTLTKIVIGLASKTPVTIMDEPTNGLDADMRKLFYEVLLETYEDHPRMFLLSTHHIDELKPLCEKIAIVDQKTVIRYEETEMLTVQGILLTGERAAIEELTAGYNILEERTLGNVVNVMLDDSFSETWAERAKAAHVNIEKASLQDYLVSLTKNQKKEVQQ
ncbi:ABC transporter [Shouchella clausii]|uniref:Multidrug ABC transporter ATP-binding protein n=3 Tax=Shouchella TaxID=2893057 RepID=Q5WCG9_SHOC1|nr:ABC transporter ATP-binding protein [Shouchella clausii]MCM3312857.1 ABC transporter ATP-binding protein [Psychrobacillus sp. MER TA 17]KKI87460.1 multidrug ABC transporter ATP-binding protein [Shouchella clausii]PAD48080.1 ABC transporter ATP-binding protein [Shouchella clausii]PAE83241.1 ABC transporter ATP-binding protein [Shouchella clausii]PAE89390.1 ABC transporter ATP-binding protein [Shouchella clausii]